jgi:hypothetical protein
MTERERLAADMRQLEWLADAVVGPARVTWGLRRTTTAGTRPVLPIGLLRRELASALVNGHRLLLIRPGTVKPVPAVLAPAE